MEIKQTLALDRSEEIRSLKCSQSSKQGSIEGALAGAKTGSKIR